MSPRKKWKIKFATLGQQHGKMNKRRNQLRNRGEMILWHGHGDENFLQQPLEDTILVREAANIAKTFLQLSGHNMWDIHIFTLHSTGPECSTHALGDIILELPRGLLNNFWWKISMICHPAQDKEPSGRNCTRSSTHFVTISIALGRWTFCPTAQDYLLLHF